MKLAHICLAVLAALCASPDCYAFYVALAPAFFRDGWPYHVQLYTGHSTGTVTVEGRIYETRNVRNVVASGSIQIPQNGQGMLTMQVFNAVSSDYMLQLNGSGGLTFSNSTPLQLQTISYLTFIQTDKPMYKPGDLVRMRAVTVDKDLIPQPVAVAVSLDNPIKNTVYRNTSYGALVFEGAFQLFEFAELGQWTVTVKNETYGIEEKLMFSVEEYVLPKFEVTADVVPYVLKSASAVAVHVKAKYTYGEGVVGIVKIMVSSPGIAPSKMITSNMQDGSGEKTIEIDVRQELNNDVINFVVEVTDETQRTYNTTASCTVVTDPVKINFDEIRTDKVFRPGLPLHAVVTFTDPGGKALDVNFLRSKAVLSLLDANIIIATKEVVLQENQMEVEWIVREFETTATSLTLKATFGETAAEKYISRYTTIQNSSLDVRLGNDNDALKIGQQASFGVETSGSTRFSSVNYLIVSRGNIQNAGSVAPNTPINLRVSTDMCPNGKLIVYGITEPSSGMIPEVIADSVELRLEQCQEKLVKIHLREARQRTGTYASVDFAVEWTDSNKSEVVGEHSMYLLAVDKSVTLLPGDNDISLKKVDDGLQKFDLPAVSSYNGGGFDFAAMRKKRSFMPGGKWSASSGVSTTSELFHGIGLMYLSDMLIKEAERYGCFDCIMFKGPVFDMAMPAKESQTEEEDDGSIQDQTAPTQVRKEFPDTWIWTSGQTDINGKYTLQDKLPDSITSWVISAFAIKQNSSFAVITQPSELQAFNPFFVSLKLPYSIRRTEKFELRATVFNYQELSLNVVVTLNESPGNFTIQGNNIKTVTVKKGLPASVVFMIIAERIGTITFSVKAKSESPVLIDQLEEKLIVKPEGLERARASTAPIFLNASQPVVNKEFTFDYSPWLLSNIVDGSRRAQATVTGDMMGNAMENLDKLISIPTGCGEQNMLTTVSNIYGYEYARAINKVRPEFEKKTLQYMTLGYNRELQYRNTTDGSFSAFTSDVQGSTWLTAFVVKCFARAITLIKDIDISILESAVQFLFSRQTKEGSFQELGRVIHTEMQGGSASGDPLTVYVVQCLLEAKKYGIKIDEEKLGRSLQFVKSKIDSGSMKGKVFISALSAYTLALDNSERNAETIASLLQDIIDTGAPWQQTKGSSRQEDMVYHQSGPGDIEITSYVLLTCNVLKQFSKGRELLLWLQKNQNGIGGFSSTQDTVLGLQAMSEFSVNFKDAVSGGSVVITPILPGGQTGLPQTLVVDAHNFDLVQYYELPDDTVGVLARVTGANNSLVVIQVKWTFYTPADLKTPSNTDGSLQNDGNLIITSSTTADKVRKDLYNVDACIKPGQGLTYSQMTLVIIEPPSGLQLDDFEKVKQDNPDCFMEKKDDQVVCYLHSPKQMCLSVDLQEVVKVENRKPAAARVIAYYQPSVQAEAPVAIPAPGVACTGDCSVSFAVQTSSGFVLLVCILLSLMTDL